ncbi:5-oxoproline transporter, DUF979 family subunit [Pseudoxanthomonas composti]|uniref:DUF979 domain-containing protein n=1 Tax=Pseudoxanthomonas composti TaxID=2137479 RepID=A0A4Q1JWA1_9GAMM|nr:DUF979 family protein [Pseudoxanthomonas composti]RXR05183.1 DUF979 domain-containing protein [Pseudoxanthomonas composti]
MLKAEHFYWLVGAFLLATAWHNLRRGRNAMAAFWTLLVAPFAFGQAILDAHKAGQALPAQLMGVGVIALGVLAARVRLRAAPDSPDEQLRRKASASQLGNRLFFPALVIPVMTLLLFVGARWVPGMQGLLDAKALTLSALALASLVALSAALWVTRAGAGLAAQQGGRLLDALGWAVVLPMMLATLGGVFAATGIGELIAALVGKVIPVQSRSACLLAFAGGMVLFTVIMGNAFAAFPVMMAGIGLPLLIQRHGADPASLGAIGMLTGYCGTLLTPMAANFNIVPAILLELKDQYGVIRMQAATAVVLLVFNIGLMAWVCFR